MDTPTNIARSEASSSPDVARSPRVPEPLDRVPPYMIRDPSERVMEHIDALISRAEGTSNDGEEDSPSLNPISQMALFHRSVPQYANARTSTSASVNIWDSSTSQSTYAAGDSDISSSMQDSAANPVNPASRAEIGNSRANTSGYPLPANTRRPPRTWNELLSSRDPFSSGEGRFVTNTDLSRPCPARGTPGQNTTDQMSPPRNIRAPRTTQTSGSETPRSFRRRRQHAQSADNLTPREHLLEQNTQNIRRHARRTEGLPGRFDARSALDPSIDSDSQGSTLNSIPGPSGNNRGGNRSYIDPTQSYVTRRREAYGVIVRNAEQTLRANGIYTLEANSGTLQNNQRTPRGLDNMTDGRPKAKEAKDLVVGLECKACMTQLVDTVFLPCGHAVLCRWCAGQHMSPYAINTLCPMCREPVSDKVRIFFS